MASSSRFANRSWVHPVTKIDQDIANRRLLLRRARDRSDTIMIIAQQDAIDDLLDERLAAAR